MTHEKHVVSRRKFVAATALATAATWTEVDTMANPQMSRKVIDTNANLFQWPSRRLPLDETAALIEKLTSLGCQQIWASSYEAVLHRDLASVNQRLADACEQHPVLRPVGAINPVNPGWTDDLQRCAQTHRMHAIRLLPGYHKYAVNDAACVQLIRQAAQLGLLIQIVVTLEDTRTQNPFMLAADVDVSPLPDVLAAVPQAVVQLLGARLRGAVLEKVASCERIFLDLSRFDGTDAVSRLLEVVPADRLLFGTHAPFLIPEASLIRIAESELTTATCDAILSENAVRLSGRFLAARQAGENR